MNVLEFILAVIGLLVYSVQAQPPINATKMSGTSHHHHRHQQQLGRHAHLNRSSNSLSSIVWCPRQCTTGDKNTTLPYHFDSKFKSMHSYVHQSNMKAKQQEPCSFAGNNTIHVTNDLALFLADFQYRFLDNPNRMELCAAERNSFSEAFLSLGEPSSSFSTSSGTSLKSQHRDDLLALVLSSQHLLRGGLWLAFGDAPSVNLTAAVLSAHSPATDMHIKLHAFPTPTKTASTSAISTTSSTDASPSWGHWHVTWHPGPVNDTLEPFLHNHLTAPAYYNRPKRAVISGIGFFAERGLSSLSGDHGYTASLTHRVLAATWPHVRAGTVLYFPSMGQLQLRAVHKLLLAHPGSTWRMVPRKGGMVVNREEPVAFVVLKTDHERSFKMHANGQL